MKSSLPVSLRSCAVATAIVAGLVPVGVLAQTPIDLMDWVGEDYRVTGDPPARWFVAPDGLSVRQLVNANPAVFYGHFNAMNKTIEATVVVETTSDDDFFGFALGFLPGNTSNPEADFLLIDWKQADQFFNFGCGIPHSSPPRTPSAKSVLSFIREDMRYPGMPIGRLGGR